MPDPSPWRIRTYRDGDEPAILRLCREVFGAEMSPEHWRWQMLRNPAHSTVIRVAEKPDGELVGHCCLIPVPLWRDGRVVLGGWSILSMVHPQHQRQGILKKLVKEAEDQLSLDSNSEGAAFAFVNQNSIHVYTRQMGWSELQGDMPVYFAVLDPARVLRRYVRSETLSSAGVLARPLTSLIFRAERPRSAPAVEIRRVQRLDERVDELWSAVRGGVRLATDRSFRYLNWRLVENPREYVIHVAEESGELKGLVATRADEKFGQRVGYIAEFFFRPGADDAGVALLASAREELRAAGCGMVTALALEPRSVRSALRRSGFRRLPRRLMPHPIHFISKDLSDRSEALTSPASWFVSWSDHDVV